MGSVVGQILALALAFVAGGFCYGTLIGAREKAGTIDLAQARDEIEEMMAG